MACCCKILNDITILWSGLVHFFHIVILLLSALGGNLGGITSFLFSLDGGQFAAATRADVVVPVKGLKRCYDAGYGFGARG
jgi:hypothetical protein